MKKAILLSVFFFGYLLNAQLISGKILAKEDNQPIPYAKIGIENLNIGAIADEKGEFKIDLKDLDPKTNLKIEVGGFEKHTISIAQLIAEGQPQIYLTEKVKDIEEVTINPKKYLEKNWGINTKSKTMQIGHNPSKSENDRSKEIAMFFKTKKKTKIEKININIANFETDKPVFIRFTIYDKNLNPILTEDLHDEITADKIINSTYSFDVSKNNIWMNNDFYVGIQLLSNFEGNFYMSGALLGNKTIYRNYLGEWQKVPVISPAINIDVRVEK